MANRARSRQAGRDGPGGGMGGGFLARMMGSWRQPAVKGTEDAGDPRAQVWNPIAKILGAGFFATLLIGSLVLGFHLLFSEKLGGTLSDLPNPWLTIARVLDTGGLVSGAVGVYWFVKELIVPWELTGLDRNIGRLIDRYGEDMVKQELGVQSAEPVVVTWEIEIAKDNGFTTMEFDPDKLSESDFALFCSHVTTIGMKADITHKKWDKTIGRGAYDHLTGQMLKAGGMKKAGKKRNSPLQLTNYGLKVLCAWYTDYKKHT